MKATSTWARRTAREDKLFKALDHVRTAKDELMCAVSVLGEPSDVTRARAALRKAIAALDTK